MQIGIRLNGLLDKHSYRCTLKFKECDHSIAYYFFLFLFYSFFYIDFVSTWKIMFTFIITFVKLFFFFPLVFFDTKRIRINILIVLSQNIKCQWWRPLNFRFDLSLYIFIYIFINPNIWRKKNVWKKKLLFSSIKLCVHVFVPYKKEQACGPTLGVLNSSKIHKETQTPWLFFQIILIFHRIYTLTFLQSTTTCCCSGPTWGASPPGRLSTGLRIPKEARFSHNFYIPPC